MSRNINMSFYELDENSPMIKHPNGLKIKLKPHQLTSIYAMKELEKNASIVIDKPDITSGLYQCIKYNLDNNEFVNSTFIMETNSAILADKVGSGKTYMIIGLILITPIPTIHNRFVLGSDHFSIRMISSNESESVNLIVVPHNLANQWASFMDNSDLSYVKFNTISDFDVFFDIDYVIDKTPVPNCPLVIYQKSRKKNILDKKIKKKVNKSGSKTIHNSNIPKIVYERKILNPKKVSKYLKKKNVFILNINRYKFFKQIFQNIKWARVIIDEMDSASIPNTFNEFGNFNWFLTATPQSIFYKSCRRYVNKIFGNHQDLLNYFIVKNKNEYIDMSIILPKPHIFFVQTLLRRVVSVIQDLIPSDVLNLVNAGNMKEAIIKLNCGMDTEENIINVLTEKIKKELHNLNAELEYTRTIIPTDENTHQQKIKKLEEDIARCKVRLDTVHERMESIKNECCFICADNFDTPAILSCCKNVFCLKCLLESLKNNNKCPYCRQTIKSNNDYYVIGKSFKKTAKKSESKFNTMDKMDVLEKILSYISKNIKSPRILIFSDYAKTFENIIKYISRADLSHALLSGVPSHITNIINEFNSGTINVLMLDSQHYGSGLNLQMCDYLILFHRMESNLETQVIGRAHRFGRKTNLRIIYLIDENENTTSKLSPNPITLCDKNDLDMLIKPPSEKENIKKINKKSDKKSDKKSHRKIVDV